jgi:tetratricopeptide (TPR) repeat protein
MLKITSGDTHDVREFSDSHDMDSQMLHPARFSAVLFGTAALVTVVHTLPSHAALNYAQVGEIARQVTVQIDGQAPGSGVIIARQGQTYFVLTAEHVVATADEYAVITPDGKKHPLDYKNVKKLPGLDLAVLTFTSPQSYRVVEMGDSSTLKEGAPTFISGFPLLGKDTTQTGYRFTGGNLLAQANKPLARGYGLAYMNNTFAGMSGGPVLNQKGQLVGIHGASKTDLTETQGINDKGVKVGLNLGIPINSFRRAVTQVLPTLQFPNLPVVTPSLQTTAADFLIQSVEQSQAGKRQMAFATINQAIRLQPNYAEAYFIRENLYYSSSSANKQGSLMDLNRAIQLNPQLIGAFLNRGSTRYDLGDKQGALTDYNRAIQLNPQFASAFYGRGLVRSDLGDRQAAITDYTEAIRLNPQFVAAFYNRGNVRSGLGDKQGAIADYNEAIRLNPQLAPAHYNRGNTRRQLGDQQGAITDYTEAIRLNPKLDQAFSNRGVTRYQLGDRQGAIKDLTEAIRLNPRVPSAFAGRAFARDKSGDRQGAIADFQKAAELARAQGNQRLYESAIRSLKRLKQQP